MTAQPASAARPGLGVAVVLGFAITLFEGFDLQIAGVTAPKLAAAFGLTPGQIGLMLSAGMAGLVLGAVGGGWLADRVSRRTLLAVSVAGFGAATLATQWASSLSVLIACRFITGALLGAASPPLVTMILDLAKPASRTQTITRVMCGMPLGGAICGLAAAALIEAYGWPIMFVIGGVAPLALGLALPFTLPALPPPAQKKESGGPNTVEALFSRAQLRTTVLLLSAFALTLLALYVLVNWLPSLAAAKTGSAQAGGMAALGFNIGSVAGTLVVGALVDRYGAKIPIAVVYTLMLPSMAMLAFVNGTAALALFAALTGFCLLGAQYSLYGVAPMFYPPSSRGLVIGAAVGVGRLGSILGPLAVGFLLEAGSTPTGVGAALLPALALAGLAGTLLVWTGRPYTERMPQSAN